MELSIQQGKFVSHPHANFVAREVNRESKRLPIFCWNIFSGESHSSPCFNFNKPERCFEFEPVSCELRKGVARISFQRFKTMTRKACNLPSEGAPKRIERNGIEQWGKNSSFVNVLSYAIPIGSADDFSALRAKSFQLYIVQKPKQTNRADEI